MTHFRLLADMNISPKTVDALRQRGWDIIRVSEILPMNAKDGELKELWELRGQRGKGAEVQGSRGAGEQGSGGARERRSRGAEEQGRQGDKGIESGGAG